MIHKCRHLGEFMLVRHKPRNVVGLQMNTISELEVTGQRLNEFGAIIPSRNFHLAVLLLPPRARHLQIFVFKG